MKTITTIARSSVRAQSACAMFGLRVEHAPTRSLASLRTFAQAAQQLDQALSHSNIALITGPSGSGKSTILRALEHRLLRRHHRVIRSSTELLTNSKKPIVDLFGSSLPRALRQLARAGLADATIFPLAASELSDGQRLRLAIALALSTAERFGAPTTVLADEFASVLDTPTAAALSMGVTRWVRELSRVRFVAATARDEVLEALHPDVLVYQPLVGSARIHTPRPRHD